MNFFKTFLASCLGSLIALIALSVIFLMMISGLASSLSEEKEVKVETNSVLHLALKGEVHELNRDNPFDDVDMPFASSFYTESIGILPLLNVIHHAATDDNIAGIYLDCSGFQGGLAQAKEVRDALQRFQKKSGKWVCAYAADYSEGTYYIASVADKIFLHPEGGFEWNGLAVEVMFYKGLFDKLEIKPEIFRVGSFKGAVEPFTLTQLSQENRLQLSQWLQDFYALEIADISQSRNVDKEQLKKLADAMSIASPQDAKDAKLVDSLSYEDAAYSWMKNKVKIEEKEDLSFIKYKKYAKTFYAPSSENEIAVIVAEGEIRTGKNEDDVIGSDDLVKQIRKARESEKVKAIVLRVNSPGGSALASDDIWREVQLTKGVKPIIASMSSYAASGGYYIAMNCDAIVASPASVTGSIGVFGMLFDLSKFWNHKTGITFDEVKTGEVGKFYTPNRPLSEKERNYIQKSVERVYGTFTKKAADGRKMDVAKVLSVAEGRVWTGNAALKHGLVDTLAGFDDAVKLAATKAKIGTNYRVRYYPKEKSFVEQFLKNADAETRQLFTSGWSAEEKEFIRTLRDLKATQGIQMRLPYEVKLK